MSRQREYNLNEKISSIKSTLNELGQATMSQPLSSLDSSRNPSLLRRVDSGSSFNSERSIDKFLNQQRERDSRRIDDESLPHLEGVPERTIDYSYQEDEDRPLAPLQPQKWEGTLMKSFLRHSRGDLQDEELPGFEYSDTKQQPRPPMSQERIVLRGSDTSEEQLRAKDEMLANMTQLQSELYMKLEECQRQLDYAKSYSLEQETQAALHIQELEKALELASKDRVRHEGYGESLAIKVQELESQLSEANRRSHLWDDRTHIAEDRNRLLEDRIRQLEDENRILGTGGKELVNEKNALSEEIQRKNEAEIELKSTNEALTNDLHRMRQDIMLLRERNDAAEARISDLQRENGRFLRVSELLNKKETELSRFQEEKRISDQRNLDLKTLLKQHEELGNKSFELRFREAEEKIQESWKLKVLSLEQEIVRLATDKENMGMELKSRPSSKYVRNLETRLEDLEERLAREKIKARRNVSMSVTPTRFRKPQVSKENSRIESQKSSSTIEKDLLKKLLQELREENFSDILPKVKELVRGKKTALKAEILMEKMGKLVMDCSPPDSMKEPPSPKRIWKWVQRVVEDFMHLKTTDEVLVLTQVMAALGVTNQKDVYRKVSNLVGDMERIQAVLEKLKPHLNLSQDASLEDMEEAISKP